MRETQVVIFILALFIMVLPALLAFALGGRR